MRPDEFGTLFARAVEHHVQGRLNEALSLYESVIRLNPNVPEACCNLAIVLQSLNRFDEALQCYDRAILLQPDNADTHYNRGVALGFLNRLEEAVGSYDEAIRLKLHHVQALSNKGVVLRRLDRAEEALGIFDRIVQLRPGDPEAYYNRANTLRELGRPDEALRSFDCAIELRPNYAEAYSDRAIVLSDLNRHQDALQSADRAIQLKPGLAEAYHGRGNALRDLGRADEALDSYEKALAIDPGFAEAYNNKGYALHELSRHHEAVQCYEFALTFKPDYPEALNNQGNALLSLKQLDEACQCYDKALLFRSDYPEALWDKSLCRLLMGDLESGWPLYEWRKRKPKPVGLRKFLQAEWAGKESLEGKTLFVHAEQGLGDTIQFCRYARIAREKGAKVVFAVQDPLMRLLESLGPEIDLIPLTGVPDTFDCHIAMMSLPLALGTTLETCPATVPYLHAEPEKVAKWRARIGSEGFRIGICWQGNKQAEVDAGRSFPLRHFENLAKIPNVRLISLQKNDGVEQLADLPPGMTVETLGDDFDAGPDAFVDTAAAMECLDLVITSDTAVAHLAGALGRPAWVALKYVPDWRWLLDRRDSPWYPTMRLFRQPAPGDWPSVFAAILAQWVEQIGLKPNEGA